MATAIPYYTDHDVDVSHGHGLDKRADDVAVFLLHGVGGNHTAWADTIPAVASAGYRCIAWDMPGYGSSPLVAPYSMANLAAALLALIKQVNAKKVVLLGHSMGGMVAQQAAAMQPAAIDGLILFATSPAFAPPAKPGQSLQAAQQWQQAFLSSRLAPLDAGLGMAHLAKQVVSGLFAVNTPNKAALTQAAQIMGSVPEATYRLALAAIADFDQRANLAHISVPTLCLAAEFDNAAPARMMQKMAAQIAGASYECLPNAGHLANMEQPAAFNRSVLSFLQRHFPRAPAAHRP